MDRIRGKRSNRIDPESTELMSDEQKKRLLEAFESVRVNTQAQLTDKSVGQIMIFGTMGSDSERTGDMEEIFYDPKSYNIIPFTDEH